MISSNKGLTNNRKYGTDQVWWALLILSHLLFSYYLFGEWWHSALGTVLIIVSSSFLWRKKTFAHIGLKVSPMSMLISGVLAAGIFYFSFQIMEYLASTNNIEIQLTNFKSYFHDIFYTLNEEMILGAIPLFLLTKRTNIHPLFISCVLAIVFSAFHFIFYKWVFMESGLLYPNTLMTLFLVGFIRNNLIITFRHIGFSWALHFGWVASMFGSHHFWGETGIRLTEPERFNLYLGSNELIIISFSLALVTAVFFLKKSKFNNRS